MAVSTLAHAVLMVPVIVAPNHPLSSLPSLTRYPRYDSHPPLSLPSLLQSLAILATIAVAVIRHRHFYSRHPLSWFPSLLQSLAILATIAVAVIRHCRSLLLSSTIVAPVAVTVTRYPRSDRCLYSHPLRVFLTVHTTA